MRLAVISEYCLNDVSVAWTIVGLNVRIFMRQHFCQNVYVTAGVPRSKIVSGRICGCFAARTMSLTTCAGVALRR